MSVFTNVVVVLAFVALGLWAIFQLRHNILKVNSLKRSGEGREKVFKFLLHKLHSLALLLTMASWSLSLLADGQRVVRLFYATTLLVGIGWDLCVHRVTQRQAVQGCERCQKSCPCAKGRV